MLHSTLRSTCTLFVLALLHVAAAESSTSCAAGEPKSKAPRTSAAELRALANLYDEIQQCRSEIEQLEQLKKMPIEEFRKLRIRELNSLIEKVKVHRASKSESDTYLNFTQEKFETELKLLKRSKPEALKKERRAWLAARLKPIEARLATAREKEAEQSARLEP